MTYNFPAFPRPAYQGADWRPFEHSQDGMTMRDYFAAAALAGILAGNYSDARGIEAEAAFRFADQMLKERELSSVE